MRTEPDANYVAAWLRMRRWSRSTLVVGFLGFAADFLALTFAHGLVPNWVLGLTVGVPVYLGLLTAQKRLESVPCLSFLLSRVSQEMPEALTDYDLCQLRIRWYAAHLSRAAGHFSAHLVSTADSPQELDLDFAGKLHG